MFRIVNSWRYNYKVLSIFIKNNTSSSVSWASLRLSLSENIHLTEKRIFSSYPRTTSTITTKNLKRIHSIDQELNNH